MRARLAMRPKYRQARHYSMVARDHVAVMRARRPDEDDGLAYDFIYGRLPFIIGILHASLRKISALCHYEPIPAFIFLSPYPRLPPRTPLHDADDGVIWPILSATIDGSAGELHSLMRRRASTFSAMARERRGD